MVLQVPEVAEVLRKVALVCAWHLLGRLAHAPVLLEDRLGDQEEEDFVYFELVAFRASRSSWLKVSWRRALGVLLGRSSFAGPPGGLAGALPSEQGIGPPHSLWRRRRHGAAN